LDQFENSCFEGNRLFLDTVCKKTYHGSMPGGENAKQSVLITGATGFIGSHVVEAWLARGAEVRCLVRPESDLRWLPREKIRPVILSPSSDAPWQEALAGIEICIHLAGATKARTRQEYQQHNVALTRRLLEAIQKYAPKLKRLVMVSSQSAAGPSAPGVVADEAAACRPVTHYGESKLAAERLLALFPGIPAVVLRPVSVYGPRDRDVLSLIKLFNHRWALVIGSPERKFTFVHVEDLVQAIFLAAQAAKAVGQTYFVSDGSIYTFTQIHRTLESLLEKKARVLAVPKPLVWLLAAVSELGSRLAGRPTIFNLNKVHELLEENWGCSSEKLQRDLGFAPHHTLENGLRQTIAWARREQWL
jgi:nucleoside-diphosphate-sugar epimerase